MRELRRRRRSLKHARALPSPRRPLPLAEPAHRLSFRGVVPFTPLAGLAHRRYAHANYLRRYGIPPCNMVLNAALSRLPPDTTAHTREYS